MESKNPIILLISGKAESGKDTFANAFKYRAEEIGKKTLIIKYGDLVKFVASKYYDWDGNKDEKGRHLLQWLGTDLGRKNNKNVWINCVKEITMALRTECDFVLVPDVRFPNEIECWETTPFFYYTIRIERENSDGSKYENHLTPEQKEHPSETELDNYKFNYKVINRDINEMGAAADNIMKDILSY